MQIQYRKNKKNCTYDDENLPIKILLPAKPKNPFESCGNCNYASHGFFCYTKEDDCMKTYIENINDRRKTK